MKDSYLVKNLYIAIPSQLKEDSISMIQNPTNITILEKTEDNIFKDVFTQEEIKNFDINKLNKEDYQTKYVHVFKRDIVRLKNYFYSMKTDYIKDTEKLTKYILDNSNEYSIKELLNMYRFLISEVHNFEFQKTTKIKSTKLKKRTRKKK